MTINSPYLQVSRDAAQALTEFSDEFRSALTLADDFPIWSEALGYVRSTNALKTTFPIPVDAAGYKAFKGNMKYRSLYARSLSMFTTPWQDGVEALSEQVEAPDFLGWIEAPGNMAREWRRLPNLIVADLLAEGSLDGPILDFYTDRDSKTASTRRLFAGDHPYNVFKASVGSFDNRMTTTIANIRNGEFFKAVSKHFRTLKGANGKPLGLRMGGGEFLIPVDHEELFKEVLESDDLVRAVSSSGVLDATSNVVAAIPRNNIYKGTFGRTVGEELADQDHFYAIAAGGDPGNVPWVVQKQAAPEEIVFDKTSERWKDTGMISIGYRGNMNANACLPHRIVRVQITG
jgi:hypothetical protein